MSKKNEILVSVQSLKKSFGTGSSQTTALQGVSFQIMKGELLVILGSSGSGKSTLLNLLGGMDRPSSGKIMYGSRNIADLSEKELTVFRRETVGYVFQMFHLIPELTAEENIMLVCGDRKQAGRALADVGLSGKEQRYPGQLSGGEQQRTAIARAIVKKPELLLCDEPTGALDNETGRQIMSLIRYVCRQKGTTVVLVTHNQEISKMGDRIIHMGNGMILKETVNSNPAKAEEIIW